MLRALQTQAFSNKVAKCLETLMPQASFQPSPVLAEVKQSSNDRQAPNAPRRRRIRRARLAGSTGTIRSSWF